MKKPAYYFLGEGALIVFSILLALGVNEWRVRASAASDLKDAVADIHAELSDNLAEMEGLPDYHRYIADELDRLANEASDPANPAAAKTPMELVATVDLLRQSVIGLNGSLQSVSWQTAKDRGAAARIDYDTAKYLSVVYDVQLDLLIQIYLGIADEMMAADMHRTTDQSATLHALAAKFREAGARGGLMMIVTKRAQERLAEAYPKAAARD